MSTIESQAASSHRPVRLRFRPDLIVRRQRYRGQTYWVVKEPLALRYFRFREEEYAIATMLDGQSSLHQMKSAFERRFAGQRLKLADLQRFIAQLHRACLIWSESPGQGEQLRKRNEELRQRKIRQRYSNPLAIRFSGIDPEPFLRRLVPLAGWLVTPVAFWTIVLLSAVALVLALARFDVLRVQIGETADFFGPANWGRLVLIMLVMKTLHELAHGIACRRFGGECHEMGVMLLAFTPCVYTNVSDAWIIPSKWQRAAVGAAGMLIEGGLAALATIVWWFIGPGQLSDSLVVVMVIGTASVAVNLNPLFRFDGYYILSDLWEMPNLRDKAGQLLRGAAGETLLGLRDNRDHLLPARGCGWIAFYGVAAIINQWLALIVMISFLRSIFDPLGLPIVGQALAAVGIIGCLFNPLRRLWRLVSLPDFIDRIVPAKALASLFLAGVVSLSIVSLPIPSRRSIPATLSARWGEPMIAPASGRVAEIAVEEGEWVEPGDLIMRIRPKSLFDSEKHAGPHDEAGEMAVSAILPTSALHELRAPCPGFVALPPAASEVNEARGGPMASVSRPQIGRPTAAGELLVVIRDPRLLSMVIHTSARDASELRPGATVQMCVPPDRKSPIAGEVICAPQPVTRQFATAAAASRRESSDTDPFVVAVRLSEPVVPFREGLAGTLIVSQAPKSLGRQLINWLVSPQ